MFNPYVNTQDIYNNDRWFDNQGYRTINIEGIKSYNCITLTYKDKTYNIILMGEKHFSNRPNQFLVYSKDTINIVEYLRTFFLTLTNDLGSPYFDFFIELHNMLNDECKVDAFDTNPTNPQSNMGLVGQSVCHFIKKKLHSKHYNSKVRIHTAEFNRIRYTTQNLSNFLYICLFGPKHIIKSEYIKSIKINNLDKHRQFFDTILSTVNGSVNGPNYNYKAKLKEFYIYVINNTPNLNKYMILLPDLFNSYIDHYIDNMTYLNYELFKLLLKYFCNVINTIIINIMLMTSGSPSRKQKLNLKSTRKPKARTKITSKQFKDELIKLYSDMIQEKDHNQIQGELHSLLSIFTDLTVLGRLFRFECRNSIIYLGEQHIKHITDFFVKDNPDVFPAPEGEENKKFRSDEHAINIYNNNYVRDINSKYLPHNFLFTNIYLF